MFLRETAISRMTAIYEEKLLKNKITEIASPAELTKLCFSDKCLIAMLETNAFHTEKEIEILKELNLEFSESGYKFYFIDGICHWEVARQLKLLDKSSKIIDRSYLFYYSEKDNTYALWKGNINKPLWNKKDIQRWIKSLRRTENIIKLKLGIDLEDK